jgi:hypothetical protein
MRRFFFTEENGFQTIAPAALLGTPRHFGARAF